MIERSILIQQDDLKRYLTENWRGFDSKDYELLAALLLARFYQKNNDGIFHVGLPVRPETDKDMINEYCYENIKCVLENYIKEDTPIDIFLVAEEVMGAWSTDQSKKSKVKGHAFQLKKIVSKEKGDTTEILLNSLEKIRKQYATVQATLVLIIGGGKMFGSVNLDRIKKTFHPQNFPFDEVLFMTGNKESFIVGKIWPDFGILEYPIESIFDLL